MEPKIKHLEVEYHSDRVWSLSGFFFKKKEKKSVLNQYLKNIWRKQIWTKN